MENPPPDDMRRAPLSKRVVMVLPAPGKVRRRTVTGNSVCDRFGRVCQVWDGVRSVGETRAAALLANRDLDAIVAAGGQATRVLGALVALTFDRDPLIGWRAVEAMGIAAERIAERDPAAVREHLRRLNWLITEESGGICWRAPEAMAEIVARLPNAYAEFVPIVVHLW
jgi:hypothetical protein